MHFFFFFFFNDTATTEIYTLSLHDALPISPRAWMIRRLACSIGSRSANRAGSGRSSRSEEHTSELQSHSDLVCRLLLEKKKKQTNKDINKTHRSDTNYQNSHPTSTHNEDAQ